MPVPVRFACLAANWDPQVFVHLVLGRMSDDHSLIDVYEFNPETKRIGRVPTEQYEQYDRKSDRALCERLAQLPGNHFIWSDEFVLAYSKFIDTTIGRASAGGCGIHWQPALGGKRRFATFTSDLKSHAQSFINKSTKHVLVRC